ncbi:MAG: hypothetical protein KME31_30455 [Tolypothrix carrinoi HA7290-LM1]|jgi:hypothetical protein|nr:hypothetical protein [Tolypothrix carrinoi HA7290-LM1]
MTAGASLGEPLRWTGFPADAQVAICSQDRTASSTWGATPTGRVSRQPREWRFAPKTALPPLSPSQIGELSHAIAAS